MVTILLLVITVFLYSPYISAAPPANVLDFKNLIPNTTLHRFQSTLLNVTYLPFLKICYESECCNNEDKFMCPVYFDLLVNINNANISDIKSHVDNLMQVKKVDQNALVEFCSTFSSQISTSTLKWTNPHIKTFLSTNCSTTCSDVILEPEPGKPMFTTIKPICKFVEWMFNVSAKVVPQGNKLEVNQVQNTTQASGSAALVNNASLKTVAPEKKVLAVGNVPQKVATTTGQPIPQAPPQEAVVAKQGGAFDNEISNKMTSEVLITPNIVGNAAENNDNAPELPAEFKPNADDILRKLPNSEEASKGIDMDGNQAMEDNADNTSQDESLSKDDLNDGLNDIPPQAETSQPSRNVIFEDTQKPRISMITKDNNEAYIHDPFHQEEGSNFFTYFLIGMFACIILYVVYHNKTKILALLLEGRRSQKGRGSRRKHTAQYRKLDTNLEEAITSTPSGRSTQIIY